MIVLVGDADDYDEQVDFADEYLAQTLSDWQDAGNDPAALVQAMVNIVNDVVDNCASTVH